MTPAAAPSYDEVFDASGGARTHTAALAAALGALGALGREELAGAGRRRDAIFMQQGITFDAGGADVEGPVRDRAFPLDLVPRIISAGEWTVIKRGLAQRIRALDRFVDDVYHGREIVHDVKIGHGRAYRDIPPIKGVYRGSSGPQLETSVRMHRTDTPAARG